jgi:hypothetical protein
VMDLIAGDGGQAIAAATGGRTGCAQFPASRENDGATAAAQCGMAAAAAGTARWGKAVGLNKCKKK